MGVNQDEQTAGGISPLHVAADSGCLKSLSCLVEFGADVNIKNNQKQRPIHLSKKQEISRYLKIVSKFDEDKDKSRFISAIIKKNKEWDPGFDEKMLLSLALNRKSYIFKDFDAQDKAKDVEKGLKKIRTRLLGLFKKKSKKEAKEVGEKRYENTEAYCKLCVDLFNLGKKNNVIKEVILENFNLKENEYTNTEFYSALSKRIINDYSLHSQAASKALTEVGKYRMRENMKDQLYGDKKVEWDIMIVTHN